MFTFIAMSCGYVEGNYTSWLVYGCQYAGHDGFNTMAEAVTELALDMYAKYRLDVLAVRKKPYDCCDKTVATDPEANFCSRCGARVDSISFDPEEFMDHIRSLHGSTANSYGEAEYAHDREFVWWPWSGPEFFQSSKDNIIHIPENAELILLCALLEAKPELKEEGTDEYTSTDWDIIKAASNA